MCTFCQIFWLAACVGITWLSRENSKNVCVVSAFLHEYAYFVLSQFQAEQFEVFAFNNYVFRVF